MMEASAKPSPLEEFFKKVSTFIEMHHQGQAVRALVLMEVDDGSFRIQSMYNNEIWFRGMIETALTVERAKMHHNVAKVADQVAERLQKEDLMAAEVKGKAQ